MKNAQLIIPHFDNSGNSLDGKIQRHIGQLIDLFGGCTRIDGRGYWKNDDGQLFDEPVAILYSAMTDETQNKQALRDMAFDLLDSTDQQAVFIQHANGSVEIIE